MTQPTLNGSPIALAFQHANNATGIATWTITVPAGTDGALHVVLNGNSNDSESFTSVTLGGVPMDLVPSTTVEQLNADSHYLRSAHYVLENPTPGAGVTLQANVSFPAFFGLGYPVGGWAAFYENVDQSTSYENGANSASATDWTNTTQAITSGANNLAIGNCYSDNSGPGSSFTNSGNTSYGTPVVDGLNSDDTVLCQYATSVNPTFTWTKTASSGGNVKNGFSLRGTSAPVPSSGMRVQIIG